jgi:hypothetical protein
MGMGIYIWRYHEYSRINELFKQTNGYVYINLQLASYVNDFLRFLYGFCCFFGTIKLLRLCRFHQRIYLFIQVLQQSTRALISFTIMFGIIFFAFICLFYLLFQSNIYSCSTVFQTSAMLFQMMFMKFDTQGLSDASAFLGPFCFSLFIFLVVFVCMCMFLSIIYSSYRRARKNLHPKNDQEIYSFIFERFLRWTGKTKFLFFSFLIIIMKIIIVGLKKQTEEEIHEERDALMRLKYHNPIEQFPHKIDQLLDALNRVCFIPRDVFFFLIFSRLSFT